MLMSWRSAIARVVSPVVTLSFFHHIKGSGQKRSGVVYVLDVLAVYDEFLGDKPLKERSAGVLVW